MRNEYMKIGKFFLSFMLLTTAVLMGEPYAAPFQICIPADFVMAWEQPEKVLDIYDEFIPQGEDINDWSEIITVQKMEFEGNAAQFVKTMKSNFESATDKDAMLKSDVVLRDEVGLYIFDGAYSAPMENFVPSATFNQMVIIKAAKATDGSLWDIQYAIKYPKDISKADKAALTKKLWDFADCR
jgi:hypothetical protein